MNQRLWVWAALCLGLAAAVWWPRRAAEAPQADFALPPLAAVVAVEVARRDWPTVRLTPGAEGWRVATGAGPGAPPAADDPGAPADPQAVAALEAALAAPVGLDQQVPLEIASTDDAAALEAAEAPYGLGPHAVAVTLRTADAAVRLRLGKVVDGQRTWVAADAAPAHVRWRLRADLRRVFDRPPAAWHQRRLFPGRTLESVAALARHEGPTVVWSARRAAPDAPWTLDTPAGLVAGQSEIGGVLNTLVTAKAERFEAADTLDTPRQLVARTFDGQTFGLRIRPEAPGGAASVQRLEGGPVARLPSWQAVFLEAGPSDLRARALWPEDRRAPVTRVGWRGAVAGELRRTAAGWTGQLGAAAPVDLNPGATEAFVQHLLGLRATGFATPAPEGAFATPHLEVELQRGEAAPEVLTVGAEFRAGARHLRLAHRPDRDLVLAAPAVASLRPDLDRLRAPGPAAPAPLAPDPDPAPAPDQDPAPGLSPPPGP